MIIQVDVSDGRIDYKLRPCHLTAHQYGLLLATLAQQIAQMFAREASFPPEEVLGQIQTSFNEEIRLPTADASLDMLQ